MIGMEKSGRRDLSGHPVGFYAAVRGKPHIGASHPSASRPTAASSAPRENPQRNPYKMPGTQ
jgi:hypothetical protein